MKRSWIRLLYLLCTVSFGYVTVGFASTTPLFTVLQPGQTREIDQNLQINVVFVGFEPGYLPRDINESAFLSGLPNEYRAVNRVPSFYGLESPAGLLFTFNYNVVYANATFENAYFNYLTSIASTAPISGSQASYNTQSARSLTIDSNYRISAVLAEKWLGENSQSMIGVETQKETIFFVNWYGRPDFKFHVYVDGTVPNPDNGIVVGLQDGYEMNAYGGVPPDDAVSGLGSLQRIWFMDLSAGPSLFDWNLDDQDFLGWGRPQYRMPPVWEYGNLAGYRPFDDISKDLGLITRFVGVNQLFTGSPLYKVALSPPKLPSTIQLDLNIYNADPTVDGETLLNREFILREFANLQPLNTFSSELSKPVFAGRAAEVFRCWGFRVPCFGNRPPGDPFAGLFLYYQDHLNQFLEGDADYEIPVFIHVTTDDLYAPDVCQCSFADDNWVDGTQSMVFINLSRFYRENYDLTFTSYVLHEVGHHLGLPHPHDGYDSELNEDYSSWSRFYAEYGQFSATVMAYGDGRPRFSQFDRDKMNRLFTPTYINQANVILAKIMQSPRSGQVTNLLTSAEQKAASSLSAFQAMNYGAAAAHAKDAYTKVLTAATRINVPVEQQTSQADYKAHGRNYMFVDGTDRWRRLPGQLVH